MKPTFVNSSYRAIQCELNSCHYLEQPPKLTGSNHCDSSVLQLSVLEPLDAIFVGILQDPPTKRGAFVAGLDGDAEFLVNQ